MLAAEAPITKSRAFLEAHDSVHLEGLEDVAAWPGWSAGEATRIRNASRAIVAALGAKVSVITAKEMPSLEVANFPAVFYQGDPEALLARRVAIVGTRQASPYGRGLAKKFGMVLARSGITVVSGGAYGIDAAAHDGALSVEGRTIAVLANSLDKLYPKEHRGTFQRIAATGGLMSSYAFGSKLRREKFLQRNSLIAALSEAVVVVEAPVRSGGLNTLKRAWEQGRAVFAVPGEPGMESFEGARSAIEEGLAIAVHEPDELLARLGLSGRVPTMETETSDLGARIMAALTAQGQPIEAVAESTGLDTSVLLSELTLLEIEGLVSKGAGGYARI